MKALLIIDMQKDFMPGGALAVLDADALIPTINQLMVKFPLVIASLDFHPEDHISFAVAHAGKLPFQEVAFLGQSLKLWPKHCVQGTEGAAFPSDLKKESIQAFFYKGDKTLAESFSVFFDIFGKPSTLCHAYLQERGVDTLYICGVATEYCVYATAKDALKLGYQVKIIQDACKGIAEEDEKKALDDLKNQGAELLYADHA